MKIKHLLLCSLVLAGLCSCGSSSKSTTGTENTSASAAVSNLVMDTDPIVIELESFEGRHFVGERSFIVLADKKIKAQIPTVIGMVRTGVSTSAYALTFEGTSASISEPRADKKGKSYSFSVRANDGKFFGSRSRVAWRFNITVQNDGRVSVYVESDEISRARGSRTWWFSGYVNKERTEVAKTMLKTYLDSEYQE